MAGSLAATWSNSHPVETRACKALLCTSGPALLPGEPGQVLLNRAGKCARVAAERPTLQTIASHRFAFRATILRCSMWPMQLVSGSGKLLRKMN